MPNDPQLNNDDFGDSGPTESRPNSPQKLGKNQKLATAGLTVFAVLVVLLWFIQLKNSIYSPLHPNLAVNSETPVDSQAAADLALKNKDTDGDGLSDYDELNLYKTSPYLNDSDSDGIADGVEVKNGTDPNCPQGRTCVNTSDTVISTSSPSADLNNLSSPNDTLNSLLDRYKAADSAIGNTSSTGQPAQATGNGLPNNLTGDQLQALKNIDAASLRQMLLNAGMDKVTLDKISDSDLMQSYNESLNSQTGQ